MEKSVKEKSGTGNPAIDEWVSRMENRTVAAAAKPSTSNPVADWLAGGRIVAFHANFALLLGSATAALLLSQLWFWSNTPTAQARDGWFWLTQEEIKEQTGLTRTEQETARRKLRELGILQEDFRGLPRKLWFCINKERFFSLAASYLDSLDT